MVWLPMTLRSRTSLLLGPSLAFLLVIASGLTAGLTGSWIDSGPPCAEEATPDCGLVSQDLDPARHRAQRLASLGVDRWHKGGIRGKGVKIAILDTGFRGYRSQLGRALPEHVQTHCCRPDGNLEAR